MQKNDKNTKAASGPDLAPAPLRDKTFPWYLWLLILLPVVTHFNLVFGGYFLWDDFQQMFYPQRNFTAGQMLRGVFPFWNPYIYGGMPWIGDVQTALFYPLNFLYLAGQGQGLLSAWWCQLVVLLHFPLASLGAFFLIRYLVGRNGPAFAGAVVFTLSGQLLLRVVQPVVLESMAWVPWLYYFAVKSLDRRSLAAAAAGALTLGAGFLAGYPQYIFIGLLGLVPFALFFLAQRWRQEPAPVRWRYALQRAGLLALLVAAGVAFSGWQMASTFEFAGVASRDDWSYVRACENSLRPARLLTAFLPNLFGKITAEAVTGFWLGDSYYSYWEQAFFMGAFGLVLVILAWPLVRRQPLAIFLTAYAGLFVWVGLGEYGYIYKIIYLLPPFNRFRGPSKFLYLYCLAGSLLLAVVLERLRSLGPEDLPWIRRRLLKAGVAAALLVVFSWLYLDSGVKAGAAEGREAYRSAGAESIYLFAVSAAAAGGALFLLASRRIRFGHLLALVVAFTVGETLVTYRGFSGVALNPETIFWPANVPREFQPEGEYFRVNTRYGNSTYLPRNQGCFSPIFTMEGCAPVRINRVFVENSPAWYNVGSRRIFELLNVKYILEPTPDGKELNFYQNKYVPRAFFVTQYQVGRTGQEVLKLLADPGLDPRRAVVLEKAPPWPSHAGPEPAAVHITRYGCNRITLQAEVRDSGLLVVSEYDYPAWKAYVNGRRAEIYRANYNARALALRPGKYEVEFKYESRYLTGGIFAGASSMILCMALLGIASFRRKKFGK